MKYVQMKTFGNLSHLRFVSLLSQLEIEQAEQGGAMER